MKNALKECIKALVKEAIARPEMTYKNLSDLRYPYKNVMYRPQFKLNEFQKLATLEEMLTYANKNLEHIGSGSARSVYRMTGKSVLKVARSVEKGIAQNKAEMDVYTNPQTAPVIAKILNYDSKMRWLVSEVVNPFTKRDEDPDFQSVVGFPWEQFFEILTYYKSIPEGWDLDDEQVSLINGALSLMQKNDLVIGDVSIKSHWGKTSDGRAVILDYGFTTEVQKNAYMPKKQEKEKSAKRSLKSNEPNEMNWDDMFNDDFFNDEEEVASSSDVKKIG